MKRLVNVRKTADAGAGLGKHTKARSPLETCRAWLGIAPRGILNCRRLDQQGGQRSASCPAGKEILAPAPAPSCPGPDRRGHA